VLGRALVVVRTPLEIIWLSIGNRNAAVLPDPSHSHNHATRHQAFSAPTIQLATFLLPTFTNVFSTKTRFYKRYFNFC